MAVCQVGWLEEAVAAFCVFFLLKISVSVWGVHMWWGVMWCDVAWYVMVCDGVWCDMWWGMICDGMWYVMERMWCDICDVMGSESRGNVPAQQTKKRSLLEWAPCSCQMPTWEGASHHLWNTHNISRAAAACSGLRIPPINWIVYYSIIGASYRLAADKQTRNETSCQYKLMQNLLKCQQGTWGLGSGPLVEM